jgi:hypothetical protein
MPIPERDPVSPEVAAAVETLEAACQTDAPASLRAAHMSLSCSGRLHAATPAGVVIDLPHPPHEPLSPGAACAVTFPLAGRSAGFTTRITGVLPTPRGGLRVTLAAPNKIRHDDQRASVRIPVVGGLGGAILEGESLTQVMVIDISLNGALIEFRPGEAKDMAEGHRRMLVLKLGERKVLIDVEVRRRDGPRYGLRFQLRDKPPRDLIRIMQELSRMWTAAAEAPATDDG